MNRSLALLSALTMAAVTVGPVRSEPVRVIAHGTVEYNQIMAAPLGSVLVGEAVTMSFLVDSTVFMDGPGTPTRGYVIDRPTYLLDFDSIDMGLQDPYPAGTEAYFVIRDNDPAVDGFFVSPSLGGGLGPPLAQTGAFGQFLGTFLVTYEGTRLPSLDILDALGSYDFGGLSVFGWHVDDGPFEPLGIVFEDLIIERVNSAPGACCFADGSCLDLVAGDCSAMGGLPQGVGSDCVTAACVQPMEACCFVDGSCLDLTAGDCSAMGGTPQGVGTDCVTAACVQPTEACCFADGSCLDLIAGDCSAMSGLPQGPGSGCLSASCLRPPGRVPASIRLSKTDAGMLRLNWSVSDCEPASDYGIHAGALGVWYEHESVDCSDELDDLEELLSPSPGNRYYLIVPHVPGIEGSHGLDSNGIERPRGPLGCQPAQSIDCPP